MHHRRGFTLVELLIVIAVIAILAGLLIPAIGMVLGKRKQVETSAMMQSVEAAIMVYQNLNYQVYPLDGDSSPSIGKLNLALETVDATNFGPTGKYGKKGLRDAWGKALVYIPFMQYPLDNDSDPSTWHISDINPNSYWLWSYGPDGVDNVRDDELNQDFGDDITNWSN